MYAYDIYICIYIYIYIYIFIYVYVANWQIEFSVWSFDIKN